MRLALTQMDIIWEEPGKNQETCRRLTKEAHKQKCDWIIFPELTLTGFTMQPEKFSEPLCDSHAPTHQFFHSLSKEYTISIAYGYIAFAHGQCYNQLVLLSPEASLMEYSKIHPFSYGAEARHYTGGDRIAICEQSGIFLSGFICYDLRFPEIFQIASRNAEIIFVIANWPAERITHWHTLLQARAIENQCFIFGINRTGQGDGHSYPPSSIGYNPYGEPVTLAENTELLYADIDPALANRYRADFPLKTDRKRELYRDFLSSTYSFSSFSPK